MSSNLIQLVFRDSLANSAVKIASFFVKQPAVLGKVIFLKVDQKKVFFVELNLLMEIVTIYTLISLLIYLKHQYWDKEKFPLLI